MIVKVFVKPNAKSFKVEFKEGRWIVYVPEKAEKGKANAYLEKELSKALKCKVRIIKGFKSRIKIIEVEKWFEEGL